MAIRAFAPKYSAHPGKHLKKEIDARGLTQKEFAARIGMTEKNLSEVLNEKARLQPAMAYAMEQAFGMPAHAWLRLQDKYDLIQAENREQEALCRDQKLVKLADYQALCKRFPNQLPVSTDVAEVVAYLRRFLRVSSLQNLFSNQRSAQVLAGAYRLSGLRENVVNKLDYLNLVTWMHAGMVAAEETKVLPFNRSKLKKAMPGIVRASRASVPEDACREMVALLESVSVRTSFVPYLTKTHVNGVTQWDHDGNPVITLSSRQGPYWDALLFSWFHEIAHVLHHGKGYFSLSLDEDSLMLNQNKEKEQEADAYAAECLLAVNIYDSFVASEDFSSQSVTAFANSVGVHPCVVLGRLAKQKKLNWSDAIVASRAKLSADCFPFVGS